MIKLYREYQSLKKYGGEETQGEADKKLIEAKAEADANKMLEQSITPELIQMKEAEARLEHGWITVTGGTPIVDTTN